MGEDASLESLQGFAGFDAEAVDECLACVLVGVEGFRLPVGAVEGEHLLATEALPERVFADEPVELTDQLLVAAECEVAVDPVHERGQA